MKSQRFCLKKVFPHLCNLCGLFFFILFFSAVFSGCSTKAKSTNLFTQLDLIDSLISHGQNVDAIKELKNVEKSVYDSWSYIGLYKRYELLGEAKAAEKLLKNSLKKNPKNEELTAVYASFLNKQKRFDEAEKVGKALQKTRYASIYAESVFQNHRDELSGDAAKAIYADTQYFDLFYDSYQASSNPVWIRNCADFYLYRGQYEQAAELTPVAFNGADDAYFWAMVNFDAGNYYGAINCLERGFEFLESLGKKSSSVATQIKMIALESDSFMAISDMQTAQEIRDRIVAEFISDGTGVSSLSKDDKNLLPLIVVNSAISANEAGNDYASADLLLYSVLNFPEYVPGLIAYADFAYKSNLSRREDDEVVALRRAGLKSREMERYDNRAQIPLSDAVSRIDRALATVDDPYLYITKLDLRYKTDKSLSVKDKTADLWRLLEQSSSESVKYHDVLVLYAVNFLLETKQTEDAEEIFRKYMRSKFNFNIENDFFEQTLNVIRLARIEDVEMAAWFATVRKKTDEALRMYEYCVFESAGIKTNEISQKVSSQSAANLANLYYALGKKDKALDLYGRVAARETDPVLRSEMFYRIASIYYIDSDKQNALRAVDYAYSINPNNAKAHLLKTKLK